MWCVVALSRCRAASGSPWPDAKAWACSTGNLGRSPTDKSEKSAASFPPATTVSFQRRCRVAAFRNPAHPAQHRTLISRHGRPTVTGRGRVWTEGKRRRRTTARVRTREQPGQHRALGPSRTRPRRRPRRRPPWRLPRVGVPPPLVLSSKVWNKPHACLPKQLPAPHNNAGRTVQTNPRIFRSQPETRGARRPARPSAQSTRGRRSARTHIEIRDTGPWLP